MTVAQGPTSKPTHVETFEAAADLSTKQFYFVKLVGNRQVNVCSAATDKPVGVLQNKPDASGKAAEVLTFGRTKVVADAALTAGDLIGTSADGQADPKVPGTDTTEYVVGVVTRGVSAAGEIAEALINCHNPVRAA